MFIIIFLNLFVLKNYIKQIKNSLVLILQQANKQAQYIPIYQIIYKENQKSKFLKIEKIRKIFLYIDFLKFEKEIIF
ncbi:MAG TPA: hypothetical protein PLD27_00940 [bacterium]|nr:hypothetical protein [bacterium]HOL47750.1 hypothetical protein [bacterium]HPQ17702.1 hypothetical protein [bacterium]